MTPKNFIQSEFDSYMREVIPVNAPAVQIVECKRAFFAGAHAVLSQVIKFGDEEVSENVGVEGLERMRQELLKFKDAVAAEVR